MVLLTNHVNISDNNIISEIGIVQF